MHVYLKIIVTHQVPMDKVSYLHPTLIFADNLPSCTEFSCPSPQDCHPYSWLVADHGHDVISDGLGCLFLVNLLHGYSKLSRIDDARRLFDGMSHQNLVSWSSAISMYA